MILALWMRRRGAERLSTAAGKSLCGVLETPVWLAGETGFGERARIQASSAQRTIMGVPPPCPGEVTWVRGKRGPIPELMRG